MRITGLLLVACVAALPACGQKGPLVLPDAQHPHKHIGIGKQPASGAPAGNPSQTGDASSDGAKTPP
jgi:predicted small lipoprotein YifL